MEIKYRNIHNIILCIFIIGIINLYNIVKYGINFNIPIDIKEEINKNWEYIININENNILIILIFSILFFIIFNLLSFKRSFEEEKRDSIEYEILIGLGLIGISIILISNDFFLLYLGIELYSFTIYILILIKETISTRRISILYLIISSISSGLLLLAFIFLYKYTGSLNYFWGNIINNMNINNYIFNIEYLYLLIIISLLFKLGTIPFSYWVIRIYGIMEKIILLYQLIIPKFLFFYILIKFLNPISFNISFINKIAYFFFIISILSLMFSSIGGLFQNKFNILLSYSSILNISFILLSLSIILFNINNIDYILLIGDNKSFWIFIQYFFIYFINLLSLFSLFSLFYRTSNIFQFSYFSLYPFFFISFFISIFSFIGFPPLGGFYAKFSLFFSLFTSFPSPQFINELGNFDKFFTISSISLFFFLLATLISSFFYFKFLTSSSLLKFTYKFENKISFLTSFYPIFSSYILSFSSLFLILYPFFFSLFFPFYLLFTF